MSKMLWKLFLNEIWVIRLEQESIKKIEVNPTP